MSILHTEDGKPIGHDNPLPVTSGGAGGGQDLRGLHTDRPGASTLQVGSTYWSVDQPSAPGTVYVTDGTNWAVVTDLTV